MDHQNSASHPHVLFNSEQSILSFLLHYISTIEIDLLCSKASKQHVHFWASLVKRQLTSISICSSLPSSPFSTVLTLRASLLGGSDGKESACNAGDSGSIPRLERSPREGNGNPLQYSCLESSLDRGAWWATAWHWVTKSWTRLRD